MSNTEEKLVSYAEFNQLLFKREIASAKFYGSKYDRCVLTLLDGTEARIGEGYPRESPATDESPLKVVAQLRNAGVPYKVDFNLRGYTYLKSYKSRETLAAEDRQRDEDSRIETRMAQ
ncbi:hypothetical protein JKP88DRAFT_351740 [Tribonema minus]|uniref:Uncharacterized protein n=1 Tax=Tribonema minus TaxID=303371 RepID=A0A835YGS7_9STRA|nr:hypothetical protein JKP88DRAFT_351740 [Tribonema minus]